MKDEELEKVMSRLPPPEELSRNTDHWTSGNAAQSLSDRKSQIKKIIGCHELRPAGLSNDEIDLMLGGCYDGNIHKRSSELLRAKVVYDTGLTRLSRKGRPQRVLALVPPGGIEIEMP